MSQPGRIQRLASEGAVIVVSILLAFWIDAWWDGRQARLAEATVLESIREEVEANRLQLDRHQAEDTTQFARIDAFLAMTPDELRRLPQDSVEPWLAAMLITWTYDADDSAAGLFLGSSTPVTDHAREVRGALARWVRIMDDTDEEKTSLWETGSDLATLLAPYTSPVASEGPRVMYRAAARLGPPLLARLREDERYVAAVLNKAHYQNVYAMELAEASVVLDTLRALMNAPGRAP